jgi:hypothetical protein
MSYEGSSDWPFARTISPLLLLLHAVLFDNLATSSGTAMQ